MFEVQSSSTGTNTFLVDCFFPGFTAKVCCSTSGSSLPFSLCLLWLSLMVYGITNDVLQVYERAMMMVNSLVAYWELLSVPCDTGVVTACACYYFVAVVGSVVLDEALQESSSMAQ